MTTHLEQALRFHRQKYPLRETADDIKLLYQHTLGAEHLVQAGNAKVYLERELSERELSPSLSTQPFVYRLPIEAEPIGNDRFRFPLAEMMRLGLSPELSARLFAAGSGLRSSDKTQDDLREALQVLPDTDYLRRYIGCGCPPVHHSDTYRAAYRPAYRVMEGLLLRALPFIQRIWNHLEALSASEASRPLLVAVDGECGSGKSLLSAALSCIFEAPVIHTDDFYLPMPLRTPEKMREPGWNLDLPRFLEQVAEPLRSGKPCYYAVYDAHHDALTYSRRLPDALVYIVEGTFALRPELAGYYAHSLYITVPHDLQKDRILSRNGERIYADFEARWNPDFERYSKAFDVEKSAEFTLCNDSSSFLLSAAATPADI